jgi:flagellar operon protein
MPDIRLNPILSAPVASQAQGPQQKAGGSVSSFADILSGELENADGIRFSKHAQTRLESRSIELGASDLKKLGGAVDEASQKGVQDSLIVMDGLAFIVNVPDRTVVTAMPVSEASSTVFTNIDGAVIA